MKGRRIKWCALNTRTISRLSAATAPILSAAAVTPNLAGSTSLTLASTQGISVGSRIRITRPSTPEWIRSLKMNGFGGGLDGSGWKPSDIDIVWNRVVTAVNGNQIEIDAPITTTLSREYGNAYVNIGFNEAEIRECGIENLTLMSAINDWNPKDEDHCWDAVRMDHVRDCWVRRVEFNHFAGCF